MLCCVAASLLSKWIVKGVPAGTSMQDVSGVNAIPCATTWTVSLLSACSHVLEGVGDALGTPPVGVGLCTARASPCTSPYVPRRRSSPGTIPPASAPVALRYQLRKDVAPSGVTATDGYEPLVVSPVAIGVAALPAVPVPNP